MAIADTVVVAGEVPTTGSRLQLIAQDVATVGAGTLFSTLFNVLLIFVIPRLIKVEDFGYWRLFMLYSGYAGFVHLGLADGALLRWAGRPMDEFRPEMVKALRFLICQHAVIILPIALSLGIFLRPELRFVGIAALAYAILINATTLLQFGLQSARIFKPVAVSSAAPLGAFLLLVFLWELKQTPGFRTLIVLYFAGWSAGLAYLAIQIRMRATELFGTSIWELGKDYVSLGWPVLLANTGMTMVQSVDRLVISWKASIQDFALYSLAASATMTVVLAIVSAGFRAFFPHLAAMEHQQRRRMYAGASRFLLVCWVLLLPYYFVLEAFVRRVLPKYSGSLPIAYILLLGSIFLGQILVLQASYAYVHGRQKTFLLCTLIAIGFTFAVAVAMVFGTHSLRAVATGEVVALWGWWSLNEWKLSDITGQTVADWGTALGLICWAAAVYWIVTREVSGMMVRVGFYYGLVACAVWLVARAELRMVLKVLTSARVRIAS